MQFPQIILLNGASSSGKSTLAIELRKKLEMPYFYFSSDLLADSGMLPNVDRVNNDTWWSWNILRPKFFDGFHRSIAGFAASGIYLLVEHIVEYASWFDELVTLLNPYHVFYIGVICPVEEIERREHKRGNRRIGEGKSHIEDGIHTWSGYDIEVNTHSNTNEENVNTIIEGMKEMNPEESVFQKRYSRMNLKK
ncbi:MAG: chloramphenicol phosphotransferase [Brevinematales bacterium]|nr:chloramphenicol phosphotransferase [Brevinematales bacterium]